MSDFVVIPILHPAYILRGQWNQEPFQVLYLKRAKAALTETPPMLDINEAPPGAVLYPTMDDLHEWLAGMDEWGYVVDVEAAGPHLTIIGLCRVCDLKSVVLRFRRKGGDLWDDSLDVLIAKLQWLDDLLLSDRPVWFHNGQAYDLGQLERNGFSVPSYFTHGGDTMLMQHMAYPDAPKGLEFIAGVYPNSPIPNWKHLSKAEGEGK